MCTKNCHTHATMPNNSSARTKCTCKPDQISSSIRNILKAIHNWFCTTLLAFQGRNLIKVHKIFQIKYTRELNGNNYTIVKGSKEACQEGVGVLCATLSRRCTPYEIITSKPISSPTNAMILVSVISKGKPWYYGIYAVIGLFYYGYRLVYEITYLVLDLVLNTPDVSFRDKIRYIGLIIMRQIKAGIMRK